jgi:RNA polymerase sigma factor (sigma-70 family)
MTAGAAVSEEAAEAVARALEEVRPQLRTLFGSFRLKREEAEDLLQDVLLLTLRRFHEITDPPGWILGVSRVRCLMLARRRSVASGGARPKIPLELASEPEQERLCRLLDLEKGLALLPPGQRQVVVLKMQGYRPREVAAQTGYSRNSVRKLVGRAVRRLNAFMTSRVAAGSAWQGRSLERPS